MEVSLLAWANSNFILFLVVIQPQTKANNKSEKQTDFALFGENEGGVYHRRIRVKNNS